MKQAWPRDRERFLKQDKKAPAIRENTDKMNFIKIKNLCYLKDL